MRRIQVRFIEVTEDVLLEAARIIEEKSNIRFFKLKDSTVHKVYIRIVRFDDIDTEFMKYHFGGYYYVRDSIKNPGEKEYWLNIQQHRAVRLMEIVLPYLKDRKEVVEVILSFYDSKRRNRHRKLTEFRIAEREQIYKNYKDAQARFMERFKTVADRLGLGDANDQ